MERQPGLEGFMEAHQDLEHARRLTAAVPKNDVVLVDAAGSFLVFWQGGASTLFRKEEVVLLPVFSRHVGNLGEPTMQMLAQHATIRDLAMEFSDDVVRGPVRQETLRSVGGQLEDHVRLEERVVFPLIEATLPEHALEVVASRLKAFGSGGPPAEPWTPVGALFFVPYPGPGNSEGGGWD